MHQGPETCPESARPGWVVASLAQGPWSQGAPGGPEDALVCHSWRHTGL